MYRSASQNSPRFQYEGNFSEAKVKSKMELSRNNESCRYLKVEQIKNDIILRQLSLSKVTSSQNKFQRTLSQIEKGGKL